MNSGGEQFERERRLNLFALPALLITSLLLAILGVKCQHQLRIDECLDSGGSYDYEADRCDLQQSHPAP